MNQEIKMALELLNKQVRSSRKKRNPEQVKDAVVNILCLNLCDRLRKKLELGKSYTEAYEYIYRQVVDRLIWKHSEASGKYVGCQYWSEGALCSYNRYGNEAKKKKSAGEHTLQHEHSFPRSELIKYLFELTNLEVPHLHSILESKNIGVVVTVREHKRLGKIEGNSKDFRIRYQNAGIKLYDTFSSTSSNATS